jgi:hypothetical protein
MSELKLDAARNMDCMFVTWPTFQFEMSELKAKIKYPVIDDCTTGSRRTTKPVPKP